VRHGCELHRAEDPSAWRQNTFSACGSGDPYRLITLLIVPDWKQRGPIALRARLGIAEGSAREKISVRQGGARNPRHMFPGRWHANVADHAAES